MESACRLFVYLHISPDGMFRLWNLLTTNSIIVFVFSFNSHLFFFAFHTAQLSSDYFFFSDKSAFDCNSQSFEYVLEFKPASWKNKICHCKCAAVLYRLYYYFNIWFCNISYRFSLYFITWFIHSLFIVVDYSALSCK